MLGSHRPPARGLILGTPLTVRYLKHDPGVLKLVPYLALTNLRTPLYQFKTPPSENDKKRHP